MYTINVIQCPHCGALIDPWGFIETGDMEGDFTMDCTVCETEFKVKFNTAIEFETSK